MFKQSNEIKPNYLFYKCFIIYFYNFYKIKWQIIDNLKCSSFFSFSIDKSAGYLFLASFCPSIYGTVSERMFLSRCLCAIIRQCTITLSLNRCSPVCFLFVLLIVVAALALHILSTCIFQVKTLSKFLFSFNFIASLL